MIEPHANEKIELIVVFKKEVTPDEAETMLKNSSAPKYRNGMDSSRGKIYFYSTGPKFILTFATAEERNRFLSVNEKDARFHEMYIPDWTKQKD